MDGEAVKTMAHDLVRRAQRGDRAAFEELFRDNQQTVYGMLWHMVRSEDDARDLTQDTFLEAWRSLGSLRDAAAFRTWLFRIAANKARDHLKRRRLPTTSMEELSPQSDAEAQLPDPSAGPQELLLAQERTSKVSAAVASLSADHRAVVAMYYLGGLDVAEIAKALGVPKGTVLSRLARARDALRRRLAPYVENADEM